MRKTSVVVGLLAVVFAVGGVLLGDEKKESKKGALPAYYKKLGLSEEQEARVRKIRGDYQERISDLQAKIKALQKEEHSKITEVLTEEQKEHLERLIREKVTGDSSSNKEKSGKDKPEKK